MTAPYTLLGLALRLNGISLGAWAIVLVYLWVGGNLEESDGWLYAALAVALGAPVVVGGIPQWVEGRQKQATHRLSRAYGLRVLVPAILGLVAVPASIAATQSVAVALAVSVALTVWGMILPFVNRRAIHPRIDRRGPDEIQS